MSSRLKSLELHGYKTFAYRTAFEFSDMVTAVVGPNGSGKSNIADSLRWVLGEQSYRLLRARKTEDMIFSGSEKRPRAGTASATVVFDNSDGWLPIDYSEVAVTRRANRDGQNEYLINGQRVRLRDVSELLAKSGLAERTYTVIGQGLVDAALSLKADERRRLFEEAAGIGLYRARREDALRRLETTRRNLDRVQDILAELKPRLKSLERQARRANEYEQVRADMRVLLREWYGYHWHRAQQELAEAQRGAQEQKANLENARQNQVSQDKQLTATRQRIQQLRDELNGWHRSLAELHTRRETLNRELAVTEERTRSFEAQEQAGQVELLNMGAENAFHQEQVESLDLELERLFKDFEEARSESECARQVFVTRQDERARAEEDVQAARQELSNLSELQGGLGARLEERRSQIGRSQKALEIADQEVTQAETASQEARVSLEAAQNAQDKAKEAQHAAQGNLQAHRQHIEKAATTRNDLIEARANLEAELARLQAQLEVLEQAETALTGYASGTRLLLQSARGGGLDGIEGSLSNHLEVPAELERAISAALGEHLDAVLLGRDPEDALNLLQAEAGRGVILPLADIVPGKPMGSVGDVDDDILGVAANLIKTQEELRPVVDLLLGRVLVVRDRQTARRVVATQPPGGSAVTLSGEVFHAGGVIRVSGGRDQSNEITLLGRARNRRELSLRLEDLSSKQSVLKQQVSQADIDLADLNNVERRLEQERGKAQQAFESSREALGQAEFTLKGAERRLKWGQEQRQQYKSEIEQAELDIRDWSHQLEELENSLVEARQVLREKNTTLANLSLEELQSQVAHWETLAAVAERALEEIKTRHQERLEALQKVEDIQRALASRCRELREKLVELNARQDSLRESLAQVSVEIEAFQKQTEPAELELATVESEQTDLQDVEASARRKVSRAEHYHAQARIALARRQEALESLRARVEDDFGLVAFEYVEQISGPTPLPLEGMVEQLPVVGELSLDIEVIIKRQRAQLRRMGAINPEAQDEYKDVNQRYEFMVEQVDDLENAGQDVRQVIMELDDLMEREFRQTYEAVAVEFRDIFVRLFGGGSARLALTDPDDLTLTGIDIEARLPGRRTQGLAMLSGGERSLTASALIFALLKVSPTPFCVLDEVDAMLDEVNVGRFGELLRELSQNTQFVVITHNRATVQFADVIYGITMDQDSVSQVLSLKMDEVDQVVE